MNTSKSPFGVWLSEALAAAGLSQRAFAEKVGVSNTTAHFWVKGRHTPSEGFEGSISEALGVTREEVARQREIVSLVEGGHAASADEAVAMIEARSASRASK